MERFFFFLALAGGLFHFYYKIKFEDNYSAPLYNYYGLSGVCHGVMTSWVGLPCGEIAKRH
jgi:membrane associated rhomboid family serine protease